MIEVSIQGGLGNQLFQYASAYAVSQYFKQSMVQDVSFFDTQSLRGYRLNKLKIECCEMTDSNIYKKQCYLVNNKMINYLLRRLDFRTIKWKNCIYWLDETPNKVYSSEVENAYMDGYFQSPLYFEKYRENLLKQICPIYEEEAEYKNVLGCIKQAESVAIHVRRGDFKTTQKDLSGFHYLLSEKYYHNALTYIEKHLERPIFFWFSDDIEWVKNKFGQKENYQFIQLHTKNADIDEMMLMKNCKHIVTANSTFSWWASWLNENKDAIHICPEKRYGNLKMIPDNWIKIAVE